ncbi:hypothetical protein CsSME_00005808 [Camellia sinensis var. sinensis]
MALELHILHISVEASNCLDKHLRKDIAILKRNEKEFSLFLLGWRCQSCAAVGSLGKAKHTMFLESPYLIVPSQMYYLAGLEKTIGLVGRVSLIFIN